VPDEINAAGNEHASCVRDMFAAIAYRYDFLNHVLSANVDKRWRRLVARNLKASLPVNQARVLDIACGTGDLSLTLFETTRAAVIGSDFCRPMLEIATRKSIGRAEIPYIEADALDLPFAESSFDATTIAFGLRNLASVERGLGEMFRVLRPGGTAVVLEFSQPVVPGFRFLFKLYFTRLLPLVGGLVSGSRQAYEYLPQSVSQFPDQKKLAAMMRQVGFEDVRYQNLTGGIAALHSGRRPD
jgi:demethylmenaquinone methyltransferase/2-methoxy-6-polyprenyl-1,4-benzoquinol methylase